ncbi:hypothetical protein OG978_44500 (plasmid) [Streptomyces sp. NBC_01591]|uniref:hypothetical protein n=1 Tax=Streptomyces sp. NBC_01591 TaxID=2975888 RepID=UPI002DDB85C1|nr:hypothetical protein [Streptomyces sp. NBC_01591]WSD74182.1 hypothetical protein OG978_44500 [Streptomyces sp. NBC_01591]
MPAAVAQQPRIEEMLRSRETFVEDLFSTLLDELGFPKTTEPSPEPEDTASSL